MKPYRRQWTADACLDALRAFYQRHGRTPTFDELNARTTRDRSLPCYMTICKRIGSWQQACEQAGIPMRAPGNRLKMGGFCVRRPIAPRGKHTCTSCRSVFDCTSAYKGDRCPRCRRGGQAVRMPQERRWIERTDFGLWKEWMKAELERQCEERGIHIPTTDYTDFQLSVHRHPRRRAS